MHLVTFDIDGTLVLSDGADDDCFVRAVAEVIQVSHVNPDWDSYACVTGPGVASEISQGYRGRPLTPTEMAALQESYLRHLEKAAATAPGCFRAVAGAPEFLRLLQTDGKFAVALATGGWQACSRFKLHQAGFEINGIPFASGNDADERTEIIAMAATRAQQRYAVSSFTAHTHVGDLLSDLNAAKALGCGFVGVASDPRKAALLLNAGVKIVVDNFKDISRLMSFLQSVGP